jgi:preprotein translocase subunit SecA
VVLDMVRKEVDHSIETYASRDFGPASFAKWSGAKLSTQIETKSLRNTDFETAAQVVRDEAERAAEGAVLSAIEENLPLGEDGEDATPDWNWDALVTFANARWDLNLRDRDLKKIGRERLDEYLIDLARQAIVKTDLSEGEIMMGENYNLETTIRWVRAKFGVEVQLDELVNKEVDAIKELVVQRAIAKYDEKESEYPVMAGMYQFSTPDGQHRRLNREPLIEWFAQRFRADVSMDELRNKQSDEIRNVLVRYSRTFQNQGAIVMAQLRERIGELAAAGHIPLANSPEQTEALAKWLRETVEFELPEKEWHDLEREDLQERLISVVADHFHPEMRRMERMVLLDVVDNAWKDHLLAMDYLKSAVGQRGMAQLDPKVEYKREGMRLFEGLWNSIGERVTDLIYRMEHLNPGFVSDTFVRSNIQAEHQQYNPSEAAREQQATVDASTAAGDGKVSQPIRNRRGKVGRNDPCPCGSGKKFKQCCIHKQGAA